MEHGAGNGVQWEECLSKAAHWAKVVPYYIKTGLVSEVTKGRKLERSYCEMLCHDCHTVDGRGDWPLTLTHIGQLVTWANDSRALRFNQRNIELASVLNLHKSS